MTTILDKLVQDEKKNFDSIPIIDLKSFIDGSYTQSFVKNLRFICENTGFLYVKSHGIDKNLIKKMFAITEEFFNLPLEEKNKLHIKNSGLTLRGYIGIYGENVDPKNTKDFKECYDMGADTPYGIPFFGSNTFPRDTLPEFGKIITQYHDAMLNLGKKISSAIALSLNLNADFFEKRLSQPITIQRILHYPSQQGKINTKEMGIGAHTDYGLLTILCQDSVGGLQVQNHQGEWISAPPIKDTFIINIGDLLQTLTGGIYISTMHRVINNSGRERYSLPFFMDMNFDAIIETVPTCKDVAKTEEKPYKCGHHKFRRFADSYDHIKGIDVKSVLSKL